MQSKQNHNSSWQPSKQIQALLKAHNNSQPALGAERAIHFTEFYKRTASKYDSNAVLKAKALADHLSRRTIAIHAGELLVGSHTEHRIGAICHVELAGVAMLEDLFKFEKRKTNPLYVDPAARRKLALKVIPYWLNKSLVMKAFPFFDKLAYLRDQFDAKQFVINEVGGIAHFLPNFEDLIQQGTEGLRERVERRLKDKTLSPSQIDQLNAQLVSIAALEDFADRYRNRAKEMQREDLVELLNRCPRKPAQSLHEALQMVWFFQMTIQIESLDQGISLGRIDQYLYPLYRKEVEEGRFDEHAFKDLFSAFCIKLSEVIPLFSERVTELYSGLPSGQAMTIGGINALGEDASNELSMMLLDVVDKFKTRQPNWHARMSKHSKPEYTQKVFEVIGRGGGSPALYNDDVIAPAISKRVAKTPYTGDVWNYATVGCVEPALSGNSYTSSDAAIFNLAIVLENVLIGSNTLGPARYRKRSTPDLSRITSIAQLWSAYETELRYQLDYLKYCLDQIERVNTEFHPVPFSSLTVKGCVESATDLTAGGACFNASGVQGIGVADVANSMAAIESIVFDQQKCSLVELAQACKDNFSEQQGLRAHLLKVAKYGNDEQRTDYWTEKVTDLFDQIISQYRNTRGGHWMPGVYSMTCHRAMGEKMAAMPSGRLAGMSLADGIAPSDGSDSLGPTASLNSVCKMDHTRFANGINLNIKFDAKTVKGEVGSRLLGGLISGYFQQGGMQVQINVLDPQQLIDAKANPEKHKNLLIRISGYSAYFVDLTPAMQDEIIERTLQRAG